MDETTLNGWLSREELILHRMRSFHRNRVEELKSGQTRDKQEKNGKLVIHCIPEQAIMSRTRYSVRELSKHGQELRAPDCSYWNPRINADGFACSDSPTGSVVTPSSIVMADWRPCWQGPTFREEKQALPARLRL